MNILLVSAEYAPLAKVGGLADAVAGLAGALAARGHDVRVVLPAYGAIVDRAAEAGFRPAGGPPLALRTGTVFRRAAWLERPRATRGPRLYLLDAPEVFAGDIYDRAGGPPLALERAALLAQAALLLPQRLGWPVDIVHAHDAHAALVPVCRRLWFDAAVLPEAAISVLTIHNLAHQEIHPLDALAALGLPATALAYPGLLEFHGLANLMKGAIVAADTVNTVSPTYATETVAGAEFGCGLEGALAARGAAYRGILNGADYRSWNPRADRALPAPFSAAAIAGREHCRVALRRELGLVDVAPGRLLCGFVGRLVAQKGVELLLPLLERLAEDGLGFALLGSGDGALEERLRALADAHPGSIAFVRGFDDALARRIYGGSDLFLMPSLFEPCGLGQMYALRYGAAPIVRRTGGLADTVVDAALPDGDGFVFDDARPDALLAALRRAEALWSDRSGWAALQQRGMRRLFDWDRSAADYELMYTQAAVAGQAAGRGGHVRG
ncbi:MAG: glycogen synthase [bacterium]|nr:glycogen synthase [bacterium]